MMLDFTTPGLLGIGSVISGGGGATTTTQQHPCSSMSFHSSGKRLFVASKGDSRLRIIDCLNGKSDRPALKLEQETIDLVQATHHEDCVLFTGSGGRHQLKTITAQQQSPMLTHSIQYMSVFDNKILRKFRGHTDRVTCLSQSPENDTFLSSSHDGTVRLWTLQSAGCLAECNLPPDTAGSPPLAAFDSTGLVFGISAPKHSSSGMIGGGDHYLHLYDARNHSAGAFAELSVSSESLTKAILEAATSTNSLIGPERAAILAKQPWTSMQFNASGNRILMNSGMGVSIILDGFEGTVQRVLVSQNRTYSPAVSCFTTGDDNYVISGNEDGTLDCWQIDTGSVVRRLETGASTPIDLVAFNPAYRQFACSAAGDVALWIWR